jgi:hypothetical protein
MYQPVPVILVNDFDLGAFEIRKASPTRFTATEKD